MSAAPRLRLAHPRGSQGAQSPDPSRSLTRRPALVIAGLCWWAAVSVSPAQDATKIAPRTPPATHSAMLGSAAPDPAAPGPDEPILASLEGLVFLDSPDAVNPAGGLQRGIEVRRLPLLETPAFRRRVSGFLGQPVTQARLREITAAVVLEYAQRGRPVVDAAIPEQDITAGTIQIVVTEGRVGTLRTEGHRFFRSTQLLSYLRLRGGDEIHRDQLLDQVDFINRNPFRHVDVIFERGEKQGETNVVLRAEDRLPLRLYAGYENTGIPATGLDRFLAGMNWGNVLGLDHRLGYQFTTSSDFERFRAHSVSYAIPLPWRHELRLYGSVSDSRPDLDSVTAGDREITPRLDGRAVQLSARYEVPVARVVSEVGGRPFTVLQSFVLGGDFKRLNNNLEFGGEKVFDRYVDVVQFSLGYTAREQDFLGATSVEATVFLSPGNLTADNDRAAFEAARAGARPRYGYGTLSLERETPLPLGCTLSTRVQAQWASGPLPASEQMGFGGRSSIRGYLEREGNAESGFIFTNEIVSPRWKPLQSLGLRKAPDSLRLLAFCDYGQSFRRGPGEGDPPRATFTSVGAGLRYSLGSFLEVHYDYGIPLTHGTAERAVDRHHAAVVCSFSF